MFATASVAVGLYRLTYASEPTSVSRHAAYQRVTPCESHGTDALPSISSATTPPPLIWAAVAYVTLAVVTLPDLARLFSGGSTTRGSTIWPPCAASSRVPLQVRPLLETTETLTLRATSAVLKYETRPAAVLVRPVQYSAVDSALMDVARPLGSAVGLLGVDRVVANPTRATMSARTPSQGKRRDVVIAHSARALGDGDP